MESVNSMKIKQLQLEQVIEFCDLLNKANIDLAELIDVQQLKNKKYAENFGLRLISKIIKEIPAVKEDLYKFIQDTSDVEDASKMSLKDLKEYISEFGKENDLKDFF